MIVVVMTTGMIIFQIIDIISDTSDDFIKGNQISLIFYGMVTVSTEFLI